MTVCTVYIYGIVSVLTDILLQNVWTEEGIAAYTSHLQTRHHFSSTPCPPGQEQDSQRRLPLHSLKEDAFN